MHKSTKLYLFLLMIYMKYYSRIGDPISLTLTLLIVFAKPPMFSRSPSFFLAVGSHHVRPILIHHLLALVDRQTH